MLKEGAEESGQLERLNCSICLEANVIVNSWCSSIRHLDTCHEECAIAYIGSVVDSTIMGVAPILRCPCSHDSDSGHTHLIPYCTWSHHAPKLLLDKYQWKANMMLPFLCPNCHIQKTILLDYQPASDSKTTPEYERLIKHEMSVEEYYQFVMQGVGPLQRYSWRRSI